MGRNEILSNLNYAKFQLSSYKKEKETLEEKYKTLEEFALQCTPRINSFRESMSKRKQRLAVFDSFLSNVKIAVQYKQKMGDMLMGTEYAKAVSNIDQLQNTISLEKRKLVKNIQYLENEISVLETKVSRLQYEYNTYTEEGKVHE